MAAHLIYMNLLELTWLESMVHEKRGAKERQRSKEYDKTVFYIAGGKLKSSHTYDVKHSCCKQHTTVNTVAHQCSNGTQADFWNFSVFNGIMATWT